MADDEVGGQPARKSRPGVVLAWVGGLVALAALVSAFIPLYGGGQYSLSALGSLCGSTLGTLAQGLSPQAAQACQQIGTITAITWVVGLAGAGTLVLGIVRMMGSREP